MKNARLIRRIACAVLALYALCLVGNWLLIPRRAVRLFVSEVTPAAASSAPDTLRIVTWNLCHARGDNAQPWPVFAPKKRDARLAEMARVLGELQPDIVVLEEVAFDSTGIGGPDQAQFLAEKLGMKWRVEQRNGDVWVPGAGHRWGTAVVSRLPIVSSTLVDFPQRQTWEARLGLKRRYAALCRITLGDGRALRLIATHLPIGPESAVLHQRAMEIFDAIRRESAEPLILAGDLNTSHESQALQWLRATGAYRTAPDGVPASADFTFPANAPKRTIDWIFVPAAWSVLEKQVPASTASDHLPVLLTLHTQPPDLTLHPQQTSK